jgi:putative transposase
MKGQRFKTEQIVAALQEYESGVPAAELCRRLGIAGNTLYRWKAKYGGLEVSDAKRLKELEDENGRLKRLAADLLLENSAIKEVLAKKW